MISTNALIASTPACCSMPAATAAGSMRMALLTRVWGSFPEAHNL